MIYSPDLLRLMGTKITADILAENHINNEQKLWRHVILNAFEDCRIEAGDRKSSLNKTDAHFWIAKSKDFDQICWWAGWEPEELMQQLRNEAANIQAVKTGQVTQTQQANLATLKAIELARKQGFNGQS